MANLSLREIRKSYGTGPEIVQGVSLEIADGEFMVLVGPSGCGKSTLLRMLAGLEEISAGQLHIDDELVNDMAPARRGVAMVFQSYALYPHMTVRQNMGFGLKLAGTAASAIKRAVEEVAEVLHMGHLLEHKPKALSGGERQRVAIGRAIVRHPRVFLFDEPLSNLDASLRGQMRIELARLHKKLGTTMVYVTHDQVEAMTLGQRIAVLNAGRLEQVGTPLELYRQPRNRFVAGFLGSPKMNFVPDGVAGRNALDTLLALTGADAARLPASTASGPFTLGIRPEHLRLATSGPGITACIDMLEHLGDTQIAYATLPGSDTQLAIRLDGRQSGAAIGAIVVLSADIGNTMLFDAGGSTLQMH